MKTVPWWREPTKEQWISFSAAWLGWVLDAFDFTIFLLVMPQIAKEFGVPITATAGSITLTLLVRLLGGVAAGWAADRWGRKLPLMLSIIWFAVCDGAIALAPSFTVVLVLRTLFGFGMGAEWTAGATLAMENWPERSRGIASGILQGSWAIGYGLAALASAVIVPLWGWRALFLVAALPALLALPIRAFVPESPDWKRPERRQEEPMWRDLFADGLWRRLSWASALMALGFGAYYGLTSLYPTMLQTELGQSVQAKGLLVGLFNAGMLIGAVACGFLASRRGPVVAIVLPALLVLPVLPLYVGAVAPLLPLGALLGGALGAGYAGVTPMLLTGLFPAHVRARSVGFVYHAGAFAAAFVPPALSAMSEYAGLSMAQSIAIFAGGAELILVAAILFRPKGTLEVPDAAVRSALAGSH